MEEVESMSIYTHIWLHVGHFLSYKRRCHFTFTFPCLITRQIWLLERSAWLQWLQPDISQCQAFPRRTLPMSPSLDLETPSAIPSPQWKLKNVLTLTPLLYTDMQYSGTFQNNHHVHFANVLLRSRCQARTVRNECHYNMFCHCVVIYTLTTFKSNWALFISIIIQSGPVKSQVFNSGSFLIHREVEATQVCSDSRWSQWFGNLGHYLLSVLHKNVCNLRVQLETFVSAPYIIPGFMEKLNPPVHAEEIPEWAYWQTCLGS